jgi:hypothetical protein
MNQILKRTGNWGLALAVLALFGFQQYQLNLARENERAASLLAENWAHEMATMRATKGGAR